MKKLQTKLPTEIRYLVRWDDESHCYTHDELKVVFFYDSSGKLFAFDNWNGDLYQYTPDEISRMFENGLAACQHAAKLNKKLMGGKSGH